MPSGLVMVGWYWRSEAEISVVPNAQRSRSHGTAGMNGGCRICRSEACKSRCDSVWVADGAAIVNASGRPSRNALPTLRHQSHAEPVASPNSCDCSATPPAVVLASCWRRALQSRPATTLSCGTRSVAPPLAPRRRSASPGSTTGVGAGGGRTGRLQSSWSDTRRLADPGRATSRYRADAAAHPSKGLDQRKPNPKPIDTPGFW